MRSLRSNWKLLSAPILLLSSFFLPAAAQAQVTFQGIQTTLVGGLNDPNGVAVDGLGNVYVADTYNNRAFELPAGGGAQIPQATV
jgi:hypothetical protein